MLAKAKLPLVSVFVCRMYPLTGLAISTVAPGTAASDGSATEPWIVPDSPWARAVPGARKSNATNGKNTATKQLPRTRRYDMRPPKPNARANCPAAAPAEVLSNSGETDRASPGNPGWHVRRSVLGWGRAGRGKQGERFRVD